MKDICMETGLSRGGLYRHYDSTQQIFSEIINLLMEAQDNEFSEKMEKGYSAAHILDEIFRTLSAGNVRLLRLSRFGNL